MDCICGNERLVALNKKTKRPTPDMIGYLGGTTL